VIPSKLTNFAARTALVVGLSCAASPSIATGTARTHITTAPPVAAAARLAALGFSPAEAGRLLRSTETEPAGPAGAYAAQRIAMAVLYGNAHAFGGPRYHPDPAS
jgi:hypothetical protein